MRESGSNGRERIYWGAMSALVLLCVFLTVHEIYGEHGYLALRRQQRDYRALQEQIHQLQQENQELEKQIDGLKSDPKAIEKVAREQMHLARPGEIIYALPEKEQATEAHSANSKPSSSPVNAEPNPR